ncbi:hypothetical protein QYE76_029843 [Lolium multiflorum]|uniref:Reverse transcriptase Ty1/copia-type domain-containing protein n=1 Tax=Lolium multiflorum TaxID=4521 RepID=A0AAD8VIP5_LOLMU|nr:hypothetical protein QYE76_029843 [Lolium multiflorum]
MPVQRPPPVPGTIGPRPPTHQAFIVPPPQAPAGLPYAPVYGGMMPQAPPAHWDPALYTALQHAPSPGAYSSGGDWLMDTGASAHMAAHPGPLLPRLTVRGVAALPWWRSLARQRPAPSTTPPSTTPPRATPPSSPASGATASPPVEHTSGTVVSSSGTAASSTASPSSPSSGDASPPRPPRLRPADGPPHARPCEYSRPEHAVPLGRVRLHRVDFRAFTSPTVALPSSARAALRDPQWFAAMHDEFNALQQNQTWTLVPRPPHANIITGKWVFKHKFHPDGTLDRQKARWVVRGFRQRAGVEFTDTFPPVVKPGTIRTVL